MKKLLIITIIIAVIILIFYVLSAQAQMMGLWKYVSNLLQPIVPTWTLYSPDDFRFDDEILPDGDLCGNTEILQKTGADDWDCVAMPAGGTEEQTEDWAWSTLGGTQTLITVTYQDATNDVDFVVNNDLSLYDNTTSAFLTSYTETDPIWNASSGDYYLKTEIDTQGEVETIWSVTLSTDSERTTGLQAQDECSEITNCVPSAWDALTDMVLTDNYIYIGDASNDPVGVAMSNDCTIASNGVITCDHDALDNFVANEHLDWTTSVGTIHTDNYIEGITYTAGDHLTLTDTDFDVDDDFLLNTYDTGTGLILTYSTTTNLVVSGTLALPNDSILDAMIDWGNLTDLVAGGEVAWGNITAGELADNSIIDADIDDDGNFTFTGTWDFSGGDIVLPTLSVDAGTYAADSIDHADILDTDQMDTKCIWFEDPTADDDFISIWRNGTANAFLITEIWGESDQTVNFDLVEGAGDCGDPVIPAAGEDENTVLSCTISADEEIDLKINSVTNTPTWVSICWTGNWVD